MWGDTFAQDLHAGVEMDYVMSNPPFNIKDWVRREDDPRWRYGVPPSGNANYAWMQHILSKLAPGGSANVVMNGSMSTSPAARARSGPSSSSRISCRSRDADAAVPQHRHSCCVWFFAKDKGPGSQEGFSRWTGAGRCCSSTRGRSGSRPWPTAPSGSSPTPTSPIAIRSSLARSTAASAVEEATYDDVAGFCRS
ncbi:MAG: N-6 DNA methylase [Kineosporiaceae bacterium]